MFKVCNDKIVYDGVPNGFKNLCAVVDVSAGLMKYGECDFVKAHYMSLLRMYSYMNKSEFKEAMGSLGFPNSNVNADILFIDIDSLNLPLDYKVKFMDYMIEHSLCGSKVKELLEGSIEEFKEFLNEF